MAFVMGKMVKNTANDAIYKTLNPNDRIKLFTKDNRLKLIPDTIYSSK